MQGKHAQTPLRIVSKSDKTSDLQFWLRKPPEERIDAVEFLRAQYYALAGYKTVPQIKYTIQVRERHS